LIVAVMYQQPAQIVAAEKIRRFFPEQCLADQMIVDTPVWCSASEEPDICVGVVAKPKSGPIQ
jgi:hypothetical protein